MQGYILKVTRAKNEDLIVTILTPTTIHTLYRFYGARHSTINLGYKIDFEIEYTLGYMPKLRRITHLGFSWLKVLPKALLWQQFIALLAKHLEGIEEIDSFYFELLEKLAKKLTKQDAKRAIVESYIELLRFEGRLHTSFECLVCEAPIEENPVLVRAFLSAHSSCIPKRSFDRKKIEYLMHYADAQFLEDEEIEGLWQIIQEGL